VEVSGGRRRTERRHQGWMATEAEGANTEDAATTSRVPMVGELARPAVEMQRGSAFRSAVLAHRRRSPDGRRVGQRGPPESRGEGWGAASCVGVGGGGD
jgi:hypothetical protein